MFEPEEDEDVRHTRQIKERTQLAGSFCPVRADVLNAYVAGEMTADQLQGTGSPVLIEMAGQLRPDETVMDLLRNPDFPDLYVAQMLAAIDKLNREQMRFFENREPDRP
jgi:hypothetical protein